MVKIYTNQNGQLFKVTCLSTDDKPIGVVPANTICEELDTGDKYFYDPVASQWVPYPGGSGSSPVPDPEVADIGKVLGIVEDGAGAKYAPVEGSGSGLPDPSELPDGTAIVAVNGEWKMQEGYGYTGDPAFEPITWDGDTEGREIFEDAFCKVSDESIPMTALNGSKIKFYDNGNTVEINYAMSQLVSDDVYFALYGDSAQVLVVLNDTELEDMELHKGVYFVFVEDDGYTQYISELAPLSVHQFDPKLIPIPVPIPDESSVGKTLIVKKQADPMTGEYIYKYELNSSPLIVNFSIDENDNLSCDTPFQTLNSESNNGRAIFGVLNEGDNAFDYIGLYTAKRINYGSANWVIEFERITAKLNSSEPVLNVYIIRYSYGEWTLTTNSYTLTPAT